MSRRDIITLVIATVVILGVLVGVLIYTSKSSPKNAPQPPQVTKITPTFDTTTINRVQQNFPVTFDLSGLGRPDPFSGI